MEAPTSWRHYRRKPSVVSARRILVAPAPGLRRSTELLVSFFREGWDAFNVSPITFQEEVLRNNKNLTPINFLGNIVAVHYANDPCEIFRSAP